MLSRPAIALLMLVVLVGPVAAQVVQVDFLPALYVQDFGGTPRNINNYTIESDTDAPGGTWQLLGTNDQKTFAMLDARKNISFTSGVMQQFNCSNAGNYRWYYIYAVDGFSIGSQLTIHFANEVVPPTPLEEVTPYFNFSIKRPPFTAIFDFSHTSPELTLWNYTITSSESLADSQEWYLFGTNTSDFLGSSNAGIYTVVDYQHSIGFNAGVPRTFSIVGEPQFKYYVLYLRNGFYITGMTLEVRFNGEAYPYVAPTPVPTPTVSITTTGTVAPPAYAEKTYFYGIGTFSILIFLGSILIRRSEDVLSGIAATLLFITALISTTVDFSRSFVAYDPPTYFANGTAMTNGTYIVNNVHLIQGVPEITVLFGILCGIAFVNAIRFYTIKVAEYTEE